MISEDVQRVIDILENDSDKFPGVFIIHKLSDFTVLYLCKRGLRELKMSLEEVRELTCDEYHQRFFNPDEANEYVPKIRQLITDNSDEQITFFQQVKTGNEAEWIWHVTSMQILSRDENNSPLTSLMISFPVETNKAFTYKINRLLEENKFLKDNVQNFLKLSKREIDILKVLAEGKTIPQISELLFISIHTAETHRKNIRRKLGANSNYDLFKYAAAFDLV